VLFERRIQLLHSLELAAKVDLQALLITSLNPLGVAADLKKDS
jgi:hypothetical protein